MCNIDTSQITLSTLSTLSKTTKPPTETTTMGGGARRGGGRTRIVARHYWRMTERRRRRPRGGGAGGRRPATAGRKPTSPSSSSSRRTTGTGPAVRMRRGGISSFAFYFARPLVCLCNIYISGVLRRCVGGAAWRGGINGGRRS